MEFVITLTPDTNGTLLVECPELPEFASVGDDRDEALLNAIDALETVVMIYIDDRRLFPTPRPAKAGEATVRMPAATAIKVLLSNAMIVNGVRKSDLARRLRTHMPQVDRLLDVRHASRLDALETALEAVGKRLEVHVA